MVVGCSGDMSDVYSSWNDVGYHNPDVITPNIDKLANMGVKLNQSYVQPVCSPSRHAFMTGYYPWKAGLQVASGILQLELYAHVSRQTAVHVSTLPEHSRTASGMATALDAAIGRVVSALEKKGLYEDTMFFFTPDNGGWPAKGGNNWPLRGSKITIWEGGTRVPAFVSGSRLKKSHYSFNGLFHAILEWMGSTNGKLSILVRRGRERSSYTTWMMWYQPLRGMLGSGLVGAYNGWYPPDQVYTEDSMHQWEPHTVNQSYYKLYNLKDDPNEYHNLADDMPSLVKEMAARMKEYHRQMIPAKNPPANPAGNPKYYGNVWSPGWCKQPMT
ncbi:ARSB-like protein [Mya arenaria]|uniref:ARSB-like protein n=1 Tax=Mya arenaria TaxID=6604 RepID=A0ABY7F177_MYAAR|nr:ARSB-like protein [Mya arenaria]